MQEPDPDIEIQCKHPRHPYEPPLLLVAKGGEVWYFKLTDSQRIVAAALYEATGAGIQTENPHPDAPIPQDIATAVKNYDGRYSDRAGKILNPIEKRPRGNLVEWINDNTPMERTI